MADILDKLQEQEDQINSLLVKRKTEPSLPNTGKCRNCGESVKYHFCDCDCRYDWEARERQRRQKIV